MRKPGPLKEANIDIISWNWKIVFYKNKVHVMTWRGGVVVARTTYSSPLDYLVVSDQLHASAATHWYSLKMGLDASEKKNHLFRTYANASSLTSSRRVQEVKVCSPAWGERQTVLCSVWRHNKQHLFGPY